MMRPVILFDLDGTLVTYPDWPPRQFPGAADALRAFREAGWRVVLYSMGDHDSRLVTLRRAGLSERMFDLIRAVPAKTPWALEHTFGSALDNGPRVIVGDSWRHDVLPALGRADAVFWVRRGRKPGEPGVPANPDEYPVGVLETVAEFTPEMALAAAHAGYDKDVWRDAYAREFGRHRRQSSGDYRWARERGLVVALEHLYDGGPYTETDLAAFDVLGITPNSRQESTRKRNRPWDDDSLVILDRRLARGWSPKAVAAFLNRSVDSVLEGISLLAKRPEKMLA